MSREADAESTPPKGHTDGPGLTDLVSTETLQALQDRFAALGKATVCICTAEGAPITRTTWGSPFSRLIGTSPAGSARFLAAVRASVRIPERPKKPICEDYMTFYATRIVQDGRRLATLVVGTRGADSLDAAVVRRLADRCDLNVDDLADASAHVDPYQGGSPAAIHDFADVLAGTIATLYGMGLHIRRQVDDLRTVHSFTDLLAGPLDLQEILDLTVRRVVEVMPVKACAIRLLNTDTGELVIKAVCNLSEAYLKKGPVLIAQNAIDAAAFGGQTVYIEDAPNDPRLRYPDNARREGIVSGLCVPMAYRGQTIGVLRVYTGRRYRFSPAEESLLRSIGAQSAAAVINARLRDHRAESERVARQVEAAGQIQRRMIPASAPTIPGLGFGRVYDPSLQLSGDFYDFLELPEGRVGLVIADVVGKGLPAALMMASVRSALRGYAARPDLDVHEVVAAVNEYMVRDTKIGEFATLVYGVFSDDGHRFRYCNAGHDAPLLFRDDRFVELTTGGMVLGVRSQEPFEADTIELAAGDLLVLTTDGVSEAISYEGEAYGRERLYASLRKHRELDPQPLARQILWDVRRFVGLAEQSDDITIVVVKAASR